MNREDARYYLKISGFSKEQIDILERTDLKPCPFCGGGAIAQKIKYVGFRYGVRIGCSRCWCAITKTFGDDENADINDTIKIWNIRTSESEPHNVSLNDIEIIGKLLESKKLTDKQKEAIKSLLKYYCSRD